MNIIFMGTPDFAVPSLQELIDSEHRVTAVFTRAPKPKGRGMQLAKSPVHELADMHNIDVYTPKTLKSEDVEKTIKLLEADVVVVVAYGFIVPKNILESKKYGSLNIHPSKLPKYRGAAPLQRTIINGERETAVCIMQMDAGMDTGDIIMQQDIELPQNTTLQKLHDDCAKLGADLLLKTLENIDVLPREKQPKHCPVYADKLTKDEGDVDWNASAYDIDCKVRGMNPWPGVFFEYKGKKIKIIESLVVSKNHDKAPGDLLSEEFQIACGSGSLLLKTIKPEGKQKMSGSDYLRGL